MHLKKWTLLFPKDFKSQQGALKNKNNNLLQGQKFTSIKNSTHNKNPLSQSHEYNPKYLFSFKKMLFKIIQFLKAYGDDI